MRMRILPATMWAKHRFALKIVELGSLQGGSETLNKWIQTGQTGEVPLLFENPFNVITILSQTLFTDVPVYSWALNAKRYAQIDTGPPGICLATVTALVISSDTLHPLKYAFPLNAAFPWVTGRVNAACGWGCRPVKPLYRKKKSGKK